MQTMKRFSLLALVVVFMASCSLTTPVMCVPGSSLEALKCP